MGFRKISILCLALCAAHVPASTERDGGASRGMASTTTSSTETSTIEPLFWNQIGNTIRGDDKNDQTGYSVDSSADG
eukprot:CAMPEP_0194123038 /NCGR_PEP_ID=MMETSP0150-20130528/52970_1 /TAXON_ID=122233 /ORGANISM="Chaetoceros debilis, Strain MM31A-1" /LENGTH=76 /DNA_ID=CAMNT_0038816133 /DNA_START=159 /DNA_END=385 /DNA_ORIENTATION=-